MARMCKLMEHIRWFESLDLLKHVCSLLFLLDFVVSLEVIAELLNK